MYCPEIATNKNYVEIFFHKPNFFICRGQDPFQEKVENKIYNKYVKRPCLGIGRGQKRFCQYKITKCFNITL